MHCRIGSATPHGLGPTGEPQDTHVPLTFVLSLSISLNSHIQYFVEGLLLSSALSGLWGRELRSSYGDLPAFHLFLAAQGQTCTQLHLNSNLYALSMQKCKHLLLGQILRRWTLPVVNASELFCGKCSNSIDTPVFISFILTSISQLITGN